MLPDLSLPPLIPLDMAIFFRWRSFDFNRAWRRQNIRTCETPVFILWNDVFRPPSLSGIFAPAISEIDGHNSYSFFWLETTSAAGNARARLMVRVGDYFVSDPNEGDVIVDCTPGGDAASKTYGKVFLVGTCDYTSGEPQCVASTFTDFLERVNNVVANNADDMIELFCCNGGFVNSESIFSNGNLQEGDLEEAPIPQKRGRGR
ncbi:hypothetical protein HK100_008089 [Physocladia obscura]|uniref:Uncharacterized protein n=1 Tax=Physocladia obscura TaxID=109957 RepID=A0AAD5XBQ2_9FUNG|nr:hypothetical protein HK100_008089 [Physocladia obscura]